MINLIIQTKELIENYNFIYESDKNKCKIQTISFDLEQSPSYYLKIKIDDRVNEVINAIYFKYVNKIKVETYTIDKCFVNVVKIHVYGHI